MSRTNSACDARVEFCSTTACFYLGGKKREGETTKGAVDEMDINKYVYICLKCDKTSGCGNGTNQPS